MKFQLSSELVKKYDVPAPRYTSYPTVPYWETSPTTDQWIESLRKGFDDPKANWALYIHMPYCETLCTFCGCNTSITKNHTKEEPYVDLILKEFAMYLEKVPQMRERPLEEIHLGGGSPTFFSPANLSKLLKGILGQVKHLPGEMEGAIEVDPRRTTREQLAVLREMGFTRVSMGVQDFNPEVQRLVNRHQPVEMTANLTIAARELGYDSVNFDLIYGLPKQDDAGITETVKKTVELRPDRIALYSFAYVPWIKPAQRLFTDDDLPVGEAKRHLYEIARQILTENGYVEIGMDHFALPSDSLYKADVNKKLHRNFMGYTSRRTDILLGLGVSAISETPTCFHQNEKVLPVFERRVKEGALPTFRGHLLTEDDRQSREQILALMTRWETSISPEQAADIRGFLAPLISDGLVTVTDTKLAMTPQGRPFLRNACMALDRRLRAKAPQTKIFSQSM